jgi:hypothetical protein
MNDPNLDIPTRVGWAWLLGAWAAVTVYSAAWFVFGYAMGGCL